MEDETGWTRSPKRHPGRPAPENIPTKLTPRQLEILGLLSSGCSNAEIGIIIGTTAETVKDHVKTIFSLLGARNRAHAVTRGFQLGLLTTDSLAGMSAPSREYLYE